MGFSHSSSSYFFLEKNIKKKIPIRKLNKISTGKELIKIIDGN